MIWDRITIKIVFATLIAIIAVLSQIENDTDVLVVNKDVVLAKPPVFVFDFISRLEDYDTWYPNVKRVHPIDNQKYMAIGKVYKQTSSYIFGISETASSIMVTGYESPSYFEFLTDTMLLQRDLVTLQPFNTNRTKLNWKIYSRKKSLLFKYTAIPFYRFYCNQILREGLFKMQYMMN